MIDKQQGEQFKELKKGIDSAIPDINNAIAKLKDMQKAILERKVLKQKAVMINDAQAAVVLIDPAKIEIQFASQKDADIYFDEIGKKKKRGWFR